MRVPLSSIPPLELSVRKVIARRAAMELRPNSVVNLGIGMPEGVASVAAEEHVFDYHHPDRRARRDRRTAGRRNWISVRRSTATPSSISPPSSTSTTAAAWTRRFWAWRRPTRRATSTSAGSGPKLAGSGGFINISQNAKKLVFLGTFLAPRRTEIVDGQYRGRRRGRRAEVPGRGRAAHLQRPVRGRRRTTGALRHRALRVPAHRRGAGTHRDRPRHRPGKGRAGPRRIHPDHQRPTAN